MNNVGFIINSSEELMGKSNRELNIILDRTPHLHCKKTKLVDLIMAREFKQL